MAAGGPMLLLLQHVWPCLAALARLLLQLLRAACASRSTSRQWRACSEPSLRAVDVLVPSLNCSPLPNVAALPAQVGAHHAGGGVTRPSIPQCRGTGAEGGKGGGAWGSARRRSARESPAGCGTRATPMHACCSPLNAALPPSPAGDCGVQEAAAVLLHRQLR